MLTFTYLGLTEEGKKARLEKQMKGLRPPEARGQEPKYAITSFDNEEEKEIKRNLTKKWLAEQEKEIKAGIELLSKQISLKGIIFEKNKPVTLDDDHELVPKLKNMCQNCKPELKYKGQITITSKNKNFVMGEPPKKEVKEPKEPKEKKAATK